MGHRIRLRFVLEMISDHILSFFLSILLGSIGFALIGLTYMVYTAGNYAYESADRALSRGVENSGFFFAEQEEGDRNDLAAQLSSFREEALQSGIVESIGAFYRISFSEPDAFGELAEIQKGHTLYHSDLGMSDGEKSMEVILIEDTLLPVGQLTFIDGEQPDRLDLSDEHHCYLYLGDAYRKIPVGTEYELYGYYYQVAGYLAPGSQFVTENLARGEVHFNTMNYAIDTDYLIFGVQKNVSVMPGMYSAGEGYSFEESTAELKKLAASHHLSFDGFSLTASFLNSGEENKTIQSSLSEMLMLLVAAIFIILTVSQIVDMIFQSHNYGIMYANGFSTEFITSIIILRNILYFLVTFFCGSMILYFIGHMFYGSFQDVQTVVICNRFLMTRSIPLGALVMFTVFFVVTLVVCKHFSSRDPVTLIQQTD